MEKWPTQVCFAFKLISKYNALSYFTGRLLPRISHEKGTTDLTVRIEKIGLKDASIYLDPFITVSVKGKIEDWIWIDYQAQNSHF